MNEPVIVTGAGGFVGRALVARLGAGARALSMRGAEWKRAAAALPWAGATIFHLAARVHDRGASEDDFMRDNAVKARELAERARAAGARRIVFVSTIKVHGDESTQPFRASDPPQPGDAYARSKWAAEEALREAAAGGPLDVTILRPPLVFGRGAGGNLRALLRLADSPWPLPFAAIANRRSIIHVDDLAEALVAAADPKARPGTYLVAHPEPISTPGLVAALRRALGRPSRLFPVAPPLLEAAGAVAGRDRVLRLTRSLELDPSPAMVALGWHPARGLEACAADLVAGREARA